MNQVVWEAQLIVVFGDTTQAIGTIVAAFIAGLGLGGLAAAVAPSPPSTGDSAGEGPGARLRLLLYSATFISGFVHSPWPG